MSFSDGRSRVIIERVSPEIDGGRFPIKRVPGESVRVEATIFADGHDAISAVLRYREQDDSDWRETPMEFLVNDRWTGEFRVRNVGVTYYTIRAWVDHFKSWSRDFQKRLDALANQSLTRNHLPSPSIGRGVGGEGDFRAGGEGDLTDGGEGDPDAPDPADLTAGATATVEQSEIDLQREIGARLIDDAIEHAPADEAGTLKSFAERLRDRSDDPAVALDPLLTELMFHFAPRRHAVDYLPSPPASLGQAAPAGERVEGARQTSTEVPFFSTAPKGQHDPVEAEGSPPSPATTLESQALRVTVDRTRARFSSWYEIFPRSISTEPDRHGTFKDVEKFLPRLASMGFDVVYLPPIHPIGRVHRKGPNNAAPPGDNPTLYEDQGHPGSPWAIGSQEGGHKEIHPELGTVNDFRSLVKTAGELDIDIALDLAYQCSPDHPYVREHPEWFRQRPDGSIQYAENPPKKYQDIYPFDFETDDWQNMWLELESVIRYWVEIGVRIFRVDNPHTKSFHFWEWTISRLKAEYPDLIFLSEAFTRPSVMYYLAKLGFTQSYTYFAWRNTRWELTEYMTELTRTEVSEYFRPNFWPNTPDILTEFMQIGGRPAFHQRLVLAATLTASYGIYGPAYELCENVAVEPGKEEYLDSEKYQIRRRDLDQPGSLRDFMARVNQIRHENPALQRNDGLVFHHVDNDEIIAYSKHTPGQDNIILTVTSTDPQHTQAGWLDFPVHQFGIDEHQPYLVEDLLNHEQYLWHGSRNYVELNPHRTPAHIFRVRRRMRREADFEYYG